MFRGGSRRSSMAKPDHESKEWRKDCMSTWGLRPSLGTRLLSCISWCRPAFAEEVPVCNLQKGIIWHCRDTDGKDTGSSNEKAPEKARETWDLAKDDKALTSLAQ